MRHIRPNFSIKARRSAGQDGGFTLVEIAIVLFIMSILAVVAIVRFSGTEKGAIQSAAHRVISDISYAQELAKTNYKGSEIIFTPASGPPPGGCFVASVCYGPNSLEVTALRGLRDRVLSRYRPGLAFISWYYRNGPTMARIVGKAPILREAARAVLFPIAILSIPFAGDAIAGGGGGGGSPGAPNSYTLQYQDGSQITNPHGGGPYVVPLGDRVSITSPQRTLQFDSSGKMSVAGYGWSSNQTVMAICILNDSVSIMIARHTGKAWIQ